MRASNYPADRFELGMRRESSRRVLQALLMDSPVAFAAAEPSAEPSRPRLERGERASWAKRFRRRFVCFWLGHRSSEVWVGTHHCESACKRCGRRIWRLPRREWMVDPAPVSLRSSTIDELQP